MTANVNEGLPYIWRKNYRNEIASPEQVLEIAHERARGYLSRALAAPSILPATPPANTSASGGASLSPLSETAKHDSRLKSLLNRLLQGRLRILTPVTAGAAARAAATGVSRAAAEPASP